MGFVFYKKLIKIYKVFNNKKGLNSINFNSIAIIGDKNGGFGIGKASNIDQGVSTFKALNKAKANFFKIFLKNNTIPYPVIGKSCKCIIYLYPLNNIYNFSCGSYLRSILSIMGIYKISSKIYGSKNFYNILNATKNALLSFKSFDFLNKCL
ncbi:MAG: hypothetical protein ACSHUF_00640 [Candidatus Nasuia deltocephalinicola]